MGFCYRQSNRRLLPASDYCRARGNQIVEHSSDKETVLDRSSRKLGGAGEHLIDSSDKKLLSVDLWISAPARYWKAQSKSRSIVVI